MGKFPDLLSLHGERIMNFKLECSACGIKQTRSGMCCDDSKCAKCYYSETMTDVKRNVGVND